MKQKFKSYKFWVALSGAVVVFVKALGQVFGFSADESVIDGIIMGFCGILIAIGLVEKPANNETNEQKSNAAQIESVDSSDEKK